MQARKALEEAASRRQAMPLCTLPGDAIAEIWRARGPELLRATATARASDRGAALPRLPCYVSDEDVGTWQGRR
jgi:hypothetical protein